MVSNTGKKSETTKHQSNSNKNIVLKTGQITLKENRPVENLDKPSKKVEYQTKSKEPEYINYNTYINRGGLGVPKVTAHYPDSHQKAVP